MIQLPDRTPTRDERLALAVKVMKGLLGDSNPPTQVLYEELAERYDVTVEELVWAWIQAGFA